jgi:hypothetical protein
VQHSQSPNTAVGWAVMFVIWAQILIKPAVDAFQWATSPAPNRKTHRRLHRAAGGATGAAISRVPCSSPGVEIRYTKLGGLDVYPSLVERIPEHGNDNFLRAGCSDICGSYVSIPPRSGDVGGLSCRPITPTPSAGRRGPRRRLRRPQQLQWHRKRNALMSSHRRRAAARRLQVVPMSEVFLVSSWRP